MATVPNVVGASFTTALAALVASGLLITLQQSYAQAVGLGNIVSQNPAPGTTLNAGGTVIITMSAGIAPIAGMGGDRWGAFGGDGVNAVSTPTPIGQSLSNSTQPENAVYAANQSVMAALALGAITQNTPAYQVPTSPHMGAYGEYDSNIFFPFVYWWDQQIHQDPNQPLVWDFPMVAWINANGTAVDWV
jgi:PASTA domain-containing protein